MAVQKDSIPIQDIYNPYVENTTISFELEKISANEMWDRMKFVLQKLPWLVVEYSDQVIGYSYASDHRPRGAYHKTKEISAYVAQEFHHCGVGTALYYANIEILRLLGYMTVLAGITLPNPLSVRFHEKMGFKKIGVYHKVGFKMGKYHDTCWYELQIGKDNNNGEIRFVHDIVASEAYSDILRNALKFIELPDR